MPSVSNIIPLEMAVLSCALRNRECAQQATTSLSSADFYLNKHQTVFDAIAFLVQRDQPIDPLTTYDAIIRSGRSPDFPSSYLADLIDTVAVPDNLGSYIQAVRLAAMRRGTLACLTEAVERLKREESGIAEEVAAIISDLGTYVSPPEEQTQVCLAYHIADVVTDWYKQSEIGEVKRLETPFRELNYKLDGGFEPGQLIYLGARPRIGKSAMAIQIATHAAKQGIPSLIVSREMMRFLVGRWVLAQSARVENSALKKFRFTADEQDRLGSVYPKLPGWPLYITDEAASESDIAGILHRWSGPPLGLLVVDYLQLVQAPRSIHERRHQVEHISAFLKGLAVKYRIPVLCLSSLSRPAESAYKKEEPPPTLASLRECVTGDTLVLLATGSRVPIRELVGQTHHVMSVTGQWKVDSGYASQVFLVGKRPVLQVTLNSGKSIRCTPDHRLLGPYGWTQAKDLSVGDVLACARTLPVVGDNAQFTEDHVALLGHMIGDGSYLTHQPVRYVTGSPIYMATVIEASRRLFDSRISVRKGRGNWYEVVISGNGNRWHTSGIIAWFKDLNIWNQRSNEKQIPGCVFTLKKDLVASFLRHLYATDGTFVFGKSPYVGFSTCSHALAMGVMSLLLRFGIASRVHRVKTWYHVVVTGRDDIQSFILQIGAYGEKSIDAQRLFDRVGRGKSNTNLDTLPQSFFDTVRIRMKEQGITQRRMSDLRGTQYGGSSHYAFRPSRAVALEYADILQDANLKALALSDLYWDRIVSINQCGTEEVFDLCVPNTHSWLADGIVSHNSGNLEHDADTVIFLHRDDPDGEDDTQVIVAKQKDGGTGKVRLQLLRHIVSFAEYTS